MTPSEKLPDLKTSISSNAYSKKKVTWDAAGAASKIDYFDSLSLVNSKNAVKLGNDTSLASHLGISTWVEATASGGYIQYKVTDFAGVTVEVYAKSSVSMTVQVSADGKSFTDLKTKEMSSVACQNGYKKYVMAISEIPEAGGKYVRIPVAENTYIGRVLLDEHSEVFSKAPYDVTFEHTDNIKAKSGVYEVTNGNTAQILFYRNDMRSARFVLRYKGETPRFKLEASDEGNKWTELKWVVSGKTTKDGYTYSTVSVDGEIPVGQMLLRVSLQKGKATSLALSEVRLGVTEFYHKVTGTNPMYGYTNTIGVRGREDMLGAYINGVGDGYIMYNVNDIKAFHLNFWYDTPGAYKILTSSDAKNWKEVSCTRVDEYTRSGRTYFRLKNTSALPSNTNYLRIELKSTAQNATVALSYVHIEGNHNIVEEMQRICQQQGVTFRDVFSVTHAAARYSNRDDIDVLNEGIEGIVEMGGTHVNLWMDMHTYKTDYAFGTDFVKHRPNSLKELAQTPYFKQALSNPGIERYSLFAHSLDWYPMNLPLETTQEDREVYMGLEYDDVYALCDYLMKEYDGTGKTFIIQTWESDAWINVDGKATELGMRNYTDYINNRQKAVSDARKNNPKSDVKLYNCMEISWVESAHETHSLLNGVIPNTNCDLYAYSCWETCIAFGGRRDYAEALAKFASKVHPSETLGKRNFYIGEYGIPEMDFGSEMFFAYNMHNTKAIINAGYRYANYWNFYCNETHNSNVDKANSDMRGFWLIRADGTKTSLYNYFNMLLTH